jgi:Tol biopolymer transport system component
MRTRAGAAALLAGLIAGIPDARAAAAPPRALELPHSYYYRELYLPQLTSGPQSPAWSPDSRELVYSMAGSLWRQQVDSARATQITDGPGYDYQPDWSSDGRWIVYVSRAASGAAAAGDASELMLLDVRSGATTQLTHGGAVNVEPRFSPDGRRLLWVSSANTRHLHLFVAELADGALRAVTQLTADHRSTLPRYYYSAFDHEINPVWTRDGASILFVSNRGRIHGTGGLWLMPAAAGGAAREIRYEETNWQARPDFSPDGQRLVYSSYLGRSSQQLWLLPAQGGEPFALTFGDDDARAPRWSPDGRTIAFVANGGGDTALRLLTLPGALSHTLEVSERRYLKPHGSVHLSVTDERGARTAARVAVADAGGRAYAPRDAWMHHAEFDRNEEPFQARYFHTAGEELIEVPAGVLELEVMKGFAHAPVHRSVAVAAGARAEVTVALPAEPWTDAPGRRWVSGDAHVHMNYGGHYRNTPAHLVLQAQAEDLDIVENLIVNKEQRIPDIAYSGHGVDPASTAGTLIVHGQEFHTSYWGHLGLLGLKGGVLLPGYAGYPNTAAASLYPTNAVVADLAHARGALVGYVHPFEEPPEPLTNPRHTDADELPVDVALGKVDYLEIVSFADHQATAGVWYRLLNLGFQLPAAAGTDAMADYATLRGPVGLNRVYVSVPAGPLSSDAWLEALHAGRSFATNGPLLDFTLGGEPLGASLDLARTHTPARAVPFTARVRSIVPLDHAQVVCNGQVVRELPLNGAREALEAQGTLSVSSPGWCLLRAFSAAAEYPVLDNFVYATTSPVYLSAPGARQRSPADARFFVAWIDHLIATTDAYPDWNSAAEKDAVLAQLRQARAVYQRQE